MNATANRPEIIVDERDWEMIDAVEAAINAHPGVEFTPSKLARKVRDADGMIPATHRVASALNYLDRNGYVHGVGNGTWRHYIADDHRAMLAARYADA